MYRLMLDCTKIQNPQGGLSSIPAESDFVGFIAIKFEPAGSLESALSNAINRTKEQMKAKGFSVSEIEHFRFELEQFEIVHPRDVDLNDERSFAFYSEA